MHFYRSISDIKAMTFDLDDTLYDNVPVIHRVEKEVQAWIRTNYPKCGAYNNDDWFAFKKQARQENPELANDVTLLRQQQLRLAFIHAGYDASEVEVAIPKVMEQVRYWRHQIDIPAETHLVMAELAKHMPLVAITNGNVDPEEIGLAQYFSLVLKAGPDGKAKPHPEMFERAASHLKLPPESILHVGDHGISDVFGAKEAGYMACWFNDQFPNISTSRHMRTLPDVEIRTLSCLLNLVRY
ncbi:5-amino-6-(5-phospho-D-ribitylamino)uracil phosphatase YigB [Vibrio nigripulchritudo]|uniref:5-amino-6-(5-phospho-D-ribitylamino)uracil phosphatase YigB n=1 Tax=Vibrio nigripulchritudo TaxID=28173 RepID=UPI0003B1FFDE|nr:5-amino-6-(5-phospho-D-ribitylamino)uracil phosphatase YigB [Vibrio nigripulchritudo]CCN71299.1 putative Haloacid dehalogenase-like hydrolase [Vibrio nigripulchritudo SFn118]